MCQKIYIYNAGYKNVIKPLSSVFYLFNFFKKNELNLNSTAGNENLNSYNVTIMYNSTTVLISLLRLCVEKCSNDLNFMAERPDGSLS